MRVISVFAEVGVSPFMAGAAFVRNVVFLHTKCVAKMGVASSPKPRMRMQTFGQD